MEERDKIIRCDATGTIMSLINALSVSYHDNDGECYTHIPKVTDVRYLAREIEIKMIFGAIGTSDNHNWQSLSVDQVKFGRGLATISFTVYSDDRIETKVYGSFKSKSDDIFFNTGARSVRDFIDQFLDCIDEIKDFTKRIDNYIDQIPTKNVIVGPEEDK